MINQVSTLPDYCILSASFSANYDANKMYLGRSNNLERHTYINMEIRFDDEVDQKAFFDWWQSDTDKGGRPFYAKLPLYADDKYYLIAQNGAFTQAIEPAFKITGKFIVYLNKTKDETAPPVASDAEAVVEEKSANNVILLTVVDPDTNDVLTEVEIVGDSTGIEVRGSSILYTPPSGFTGIKTFQYRANDGTFWSNTATITIYVREIAQPIARDIDITVAINATSLTDGEKRYFKLAAFDPDGRPLTYEIVNTGTAINLALAEGDNTSSWVILDAGVAIGEIYDFTYKVNNGVKDSDVMDVKVTTTAVQAFTLKGTIPTQLNCPTTQSDTVAFSFFNFSITGNLYDDINCAKVTVTGAVNGSLPDSISSINILDMGSNSLNVFTNRQLVLSTSGTSTAGTAIYDYTVTSYGGHEYVGAINIEMIDTSHTRRLYTAYEEKKKTIYLEFQGDDATFGIFSTPLFGYPSAGDFANIMSGFTWMSPSVFMGDLVGLGDYFLLYTITSMPTGGTSYSIDNRGLVTFTMDAIKLSDTMQVEVSNAIGDTVTFDITVRRNS